MQARRRSSSGFTLIELILVLTVLAIVSALVAPKMFAFSVSRNTRNAADRIVAMAQYAHTMSIGDAEMFRLNYDESGRVFFLTVDNAGSFSAPTNDFGDRFVLPTAMKVDTNIPTQSDGRYVLFQPTGMTDPAYITLSDQFGNTITVACASATEMFHVLRPGEAVQ